jgi:hypothetical protein
VLRYVVYGVPLVVEGLVSVGRADRVLGEAQC